MAETKNGKKLLDECSYVVTTAVNTTEKSFIYDRCLTYVLSVSVHVADYRMSIIQVHLPGHRLPQASRNALKKDLEKYRRARRTSRTVLPASS